MDTAVLIGIIAALVLAWASIAGGVVLYRGSERVGWRALGMSAVAGGIGVLVVFSFLLPVSSEGQAPEPAVAGEVVSTEPTNAPTTSQEPPSPTSSGMMVPRPGNVDELVSRSQVIVLGKIGPDPVERRIGPYGEDGKLLPVDDEGGLPFTDYLVRIEDVLKADDSVANSDTLVLRMFGHLSDRNAIITPNVFTLPNPGDYLLFALGRNPDGTYGSGPEGILNVDGEKVAFADGVAFGAQVSPDQLIREIKDAAAGTSGDTPAGSVPSAVQNPTNPMPGSGSAPDDTSQKIAQSQAQRDTSPDVSQASLSQLTAGNTAFAFDLYQALREDNGNLFFSPFSISTALAMAYAGARNETETQMAATLHFTQPQERLHPAINALDREFNDPDVGSLGDDFQLRVANSLWGQIDFEIKADFLDLIARSYGAGLRLVDFIDPVNREQARLAINQWASDQTEGKIEDLVPDNILSDVTRLVLANAIYFNAKWDRPFLSGTKDDEFNLLDGDRVTVQMMSRRARTNYAQGQGYQAVELAYKGGSAQMIVLLPDQGRFEDIEASLGRELMDEVLQGFASTDVRLFMPRFEYEAELVLADTLAAMGMPDAFDTQKADFTGIVVNPKPTLYIKDVLHKAFVAVDEIGTEAAAATAVIMEIESMPTVVKIDRPFIFIIRHSEHDTILFVGRVLDPTA